MVVKAVGGGGGDGLGGGGGVLLADLSRVLEFFHVIPFITFHIEDVSWLSLTNWLK